MSQAPYLILESQGGGHLPLTEFTNFGRSEDNAVVFKDIGVSTHHAVIRKDGAFWVVEDLGSTNGTWLNHKRVEGPTVVKEGDLLQMGSQRMRVAGFRGSPQELREPSPGSCPRCQKLLPPQAAFCPGCGAAAQPSGWPTSTMPFQVPYPHGVPPRPKDASRNVVVLALVILGAVAIVLSIVLGLTLREKTAKPNARAAESASLS